MRVCIFAVLVFLQYSSSRRLCGPLGRLITTEEVPIISWAFALLREILEAGMPRVCVMFRASMVQAGSREEVDPLCRVDDYHNRHRQQNRHSMAWYGTARIRIYFLTFEQLEWGKKGRKVRGCKAVSQLLFAGVS